MLFRGEKDERGCKPELVKDCSKEDGNPLFFIVTERIAQNSTPTLQ